MSDLVVVGPSGLTKEAKDNNGNTTGPQSLTQVASAGVITQNPTDQSAAVGLLRTDGWVAGVVAFWDIPTPGQAIYDKDTVELDVDRFSTTAGARNFEQEQVPLLLKINNLGGLGTSTTLAVTAVPGVTAIVTTTATDTLFSVMFVKGPYVVSVDALGKGNEITSGEIADLASRQFARLPA